MTRKDFEVIAAVIKNLPQRSLTISTTAQEEIAKTFADMCAQQNRNFVRNRFLTACGVLDK